MTYFDAIKQKMPHFFDGVSVLEYGPHSHCKAIEPLFTNSHYIVLDPASNDLSGVQMDSFRVAISVERFQNTPNHLQEFVGLHKVASKFVMFSCAAAGRKPTRQLKNLTEADFYLTLDIDSMFERHMFHADHVDSTLYFWGIKNEMGYN